MVREIITIVCAVAVVDGVIVAEPARRERVFEAPSGEQRAETVEIITTTGEAVS